MSSETASRIGPPDDDDQPSIEARGLGKSFALYDRPQDRLLQMLWPGRRRFHRDFVAVRDVDLRVAKGECVGVVGRNGSGKSTLLNMICGTLQPTTGELCVRGRVAPMLALGAGFSPEFTGRENVVLNATLLGSTREELEARMDSIVEFAEIGEFFDQPVRRYSTGMYSRLAFAAAIAADPEILVMDEVLAVGDEAFTRKCFARIDQIKASGATVFFASHSPNLILELCDRAILMEEGECLLQADPKTVIAQHHRLLYAPPESREQIRGHVRAIGRLPEDERAAAVAADRPGIQAVVPVDFGRFDPALRPESTQEYGRHTARIQGIRVLDPNGRPVNLLRAGQPYRYAYEVAFEVAAENVRFGMMIKLVTGLELGGQASAAPGEGLSRVEAGSRVSVEFSFVARLLPGPYFLNAGVLAVVDEEEVYLHRILDALMIKVLPDDEVRFTGLVDFVGDEPPRVEVDATPMDHAERVARVQGASE